MILPRIVVCHVILPRFVVRRVILTWIVVLRRVIIPRFPRLRSPHDFNEDCSIASAVVFVLGSDDAPIIRHPRHPTLVLRYIDIDMLRLIYYSCSL
jgi:hypothetical protein